MRWFTLLILVLGLLSGGALAQNSDPEALVSLGMENTALETGQRYTVTITIDDVQNLWLIDLEIQYDPDTLYVIGTQSGSPIRAGDFFTSGSAVTVRNSVAEPGRLIYTRSQLAPADPLSGNGVIGTFEVYPLQSGDIDLTFAGLTLTEIIRETDETGTPQNTTTQAIPALPVLASLSISGDPVPIPDEATATPTATVTATPAVETTEEATITPTPTLRNVTAAPPATATPEATVTPVPDDIEPIADSGLPLLPLALGLIVVAVIGLVIVFIVARRQ